MPPRIDLGSADRVNIVILTLNILNLSLSSNLKTILRHAAALFYLGQPRIDHLDPVLYHVLYDLLELGGLRRQQLRFAVLKVELLVGLSEPKHLAFQPTLKQCKSILKLIII